MNIDIFAAPCLFFGFRSVPGGKLTMSRLKITQKTIQDELVSLGIPEIANHSQRFFKTAKGEYGEGDAFLGIRVPVIRKLVTKYLSTELQIVVKLLHSRYHEIRLFAALLLVKKYQQFENQGNEQADSLNKKKIYELYMENLSCINSWDIVDTSAIHIVGAYLSERDKSVLYTLSGSNSLWERRISIISTHYFIRQSRFDDTLAIAEILMKDDEDLIHKAVGWMLREIGNRSFETEDEFLKENYQNMPRTMLRYAIEKFPEARRQAYLKGKA